MLDEPQPATTIPVADPLPTDDPWQYDAKLSETARAALDQPFPPPATTYPDPLPPPLEDPLRVLRWLVSVWLVLVPVLWMVSVWDEPRPEDTPWLVAQAQWVAALWLLFGIWRLLPSRRTDVFYLRSFGFDESTAAVRSDLLRAFGRGVRLSGIRDPGRRSIPWWRHINQLVFVLRYATPKYLNLEAGDDWKPRLWRSLTQSRGAVLDVTDLTPYVKDEVRMCYRTLGPDRLMFVVDASRTPDEWQALLASVLELPDGSGLRLNEKGRTDDGKKRFRAEAVAFARQLPNCPPDPSPAGSEVAYQLWSARIDNHWTSRPWVEVIGATLLVGLILGVVSATIQYAKFSVLNSGNNVKEGLLFLQCVSLPFVGMALWLLVVQLNALLVYLRECGSARERWLTFGTLGLALVGAPLLVAAPAAWKVKLAADRLTVSNQLKQLGIAMHNYHDDNNHFPSADTDADEKPPSADRPAVSWRVKLLPFLEQDRIAAGYRQSEPWDSPHNQQFIEQMPPVFRRPGRSAPPGYTFYRVFVNPRNQSGPSAVFSRDRPTTIAGISDGTSATILIVEAAEAVPWTKPDELVYSPDGPLPRLGFGNTIGVAMADGSVRFLSSDIPEKTLRMLITRNGGEPINLP